MDQNKKYQFNWAYKINSERFNGLVSERIYLIAGHAKYLGPQSGNTL